MSRRNQASQSQPTSSNNAASQAQGSTNQPFEVSVEPTNRNPEIWCHFELVRMSDGSRIEGLVVRLVTLISIPMETLR